MQLLGSVIGWLFGDGLVAGLGHDYGGRTKIALSPGRAREVFNTGRGKRGGGRERL